MRWYALQPEYQARFGITASDLRDDERLFAFLARAGGLDHPADFESLHSIVEKILDDQTFPFDSQTELAKIEAWMTQLGMMPFDENALPAEDPRTLCQIR